jgi:hypothetical protein
MGRARSRDHDLPRYLARKGYSYYFVTKAPRRWLPLGQDRGDALEQHADMLAELGYGVPIPLLPNGYTVGVLLDLVRRSARCRGIENTLGPEEIGRLVTRAKGRCEVSRLRFQAARPMGQRIRVFAPSVDRIDNARGYVFDNCRLVCAGVNVAMNRFGADFLAKLRLVARAEL